MTEDMPSHEILENQVWKYPKAIVGKLPNNTERREAERLLDVVRDLAYEARERPADRAD